MCFHRSDQRRCIWFRLPTYSTLVVTWPSVCMRGVQLTVWSLETSLEIVWKEISLLIVILSFCFRLLTVVMQAGLVQPSIPQWSLSSISLNTIHLTSLCKALYCPEIVKQMSYLNVRGRVKIDKVLYFQRTVQTQRNSRVVLACCWFIHFVKYNLLALPSIAHAVIQ